MYCYFLFFILFYNVHSQIQKNVYGLIIFTQTASCYSFHKNAPMSRSNKNPGGIRQRWSCYSSVCRASYVEVTLSSGLSLFFCPIFAHQLQLKGVAAEFKPRYSSTKRDARANLVRSCILAQSVGQSELCKTRLTLFSVVVALSFHHCVMRACSSLNEGSDLNECKPSVPCM